MHTNSNQSPHNEAQRARAASANTLASFKVVPSGAAVGAEIRGVDLAQPVPEDVKAALRKAWAVLNAGHIDIGLEPKTPA